MMKLLIPVVLIAVGAGAGVFAGLSLRPEPEACAPDDEACRTAEERSEQNAKKTVNKDTTFVELDRQFVVPIIRDTRIHALVVASLSVEVASGDADHARNLEPKLRDAFVQVLFVHAHGGGFDGDFTALQAMEDLRGRLDEAGREILGDGFEKVLITEIVRQDM